MYYTYACTVKLNESKERLMYYVKEHAICILITYGGHDHYRRGLLGFYSGIYEVLILGFCSGIFEVLTLMGRNAATSWDI
jgi:hypothetical protein